MPMNPSKYLLLLFCFLWTCKANPDHLNFRNSLSKGMIAAQSNQKPVFIYFGAWSLGYSEFDNVFMHDRAIQNKLNKNFNTVLLKVDDKTLAERLDKKIVDFIPMEEEDKTLIAKAKNKGKVNQIIQNVLLSSNTQPTYLILDAKGNQVIEPFEYTRQNKKLFLRKLKRALAQYAQD